MTTLDRMMQLGKLIDERDSTITGLRETAVNQCKEVERLKEKLAKGCERLDGEKSLSDIIHADRIQLRKDNASLSQKVERLKDRILRDATDGRIERNNLRASLAASEAVVAAVRPMIADLATMHADDRCFAKYSKNEWLAALSPSPPQECIRRRAPWPDYAGNPIHEGDRIKHPSGSLGVVECLDGEGLTDQDRWRVRYFEVSGRARLCLQIGPKGHAVVVQKAAQPQACKQEETDDE